MHLLVVKASKKSEKEGLLKPDFEVAIDKYNETLIKAGVRVMDKGLYPSLDGLRLSLLAQWLTRGV